MQYNHPPPGAPPGPPGYGPPAGGFAPGQAAQPMPQAGGGYEFNEQENGRIKLAAMFTKIFGGVSFLTGGIAFLLSFVPFITLGFIPQAFVNVMFASIGALISIGIGYMYYSSGQAFSRVVDTQGDDITHLVDAIGRLRSAFRFEVILFGVAFGFIIIALVVMMLIWGTAVLASAAAFR